MTPYDVGQHWFKQWLVAWRHQAITWTSVDLSTVRSSDIHLKTNSQEIPQTLVTAIIWKIKYPYLHSNFPGANELTYLSWNNMASVPGGLTHRGLNKMDDISLMNFSNAFYSQTSSFLVCIFVSDLHKLALNQRWRNSRTHKYVTIRQWVKHLAIFSCVFEFHMGILWDHCGNSTYLSNPLLPLTSAKTISVFTNGECTVHCIVWIAQGNNCWPNNEHRCFGYKSRVCIDHRVCITNYGDNLLTE